MDDELSWICLQPGFLIKCYICRNKPNSFQNLFYSHSNKFHVSSNTLSENWVVNKSKSTHHPSQLINVTDIWHKWSLVLYLGVKQSRQHALKGELTVLIYIYCDSRITELEQLLAAKNELLKKTEVALERERNCSSEKALWFKINNLIWKFNHFWAPKEKRQIFPINQLLNKNSF